MTVIEGPWSTITVQEFIQSHGGQNVSTSNIANRFGWPQRDAYRRLLKMEERGEIERVGRGAYGEVGATQYWNVTKKGKQAEEN